MNENLKEMLSYVAIIIVVILVRTFLVTPIRVNGDSMNTTLHDGNIMVLKKFDKSIERFDIVVIKYKDEKIIKRVIGLPEEDIEYKDDTLYINGERVEETYGSNTTRNFKDYCGKNEYFVLGDNRGNSKDSRSIGCVKKNDIIGTTRLVLFPFNRIGIVD